MSLPGYGFESTDPRNQLAFVPASSQRGPPFAEKTSCNRQWARSRHQQVQRTPVLRIPQVGRLVTRVARCGPLHPRLPRKLFAQLEQSYRRTEPGMRTLASFVSLQFQDRATSLTRALKKI